MRVKTTLSAACLFGVLLGVGTSTISPPAAIAARQEATPLMAEGTGMAGRPSDRVRALQVRLGAKGYKLGSSGVDGRFGPITRRAVQQLQRDYGLIQDGIAGPKTRKLLRAICARHACRSQAASRTAGPSHPNGQKTARVIPAGSGSGSGRGDWTEIVLAAIAGLLALAYGLDLIRGRRRIKSSTTVVPIDHEMNVQGVSWAAGPFRGRAIALAYRKSAGTDGSPQAMYLVSDSEKPAPVWVRVEEIARLTLPRPKVIGYVGEPAGPITGDANAQELAIWEECRRRGWDLLEVLHEVPGGDDEALDYALERIARGDAPNLVASSLGRSSDSAPRLRELVGWFAQTKRTLVVLDMGIDLSTREGLKEGLEEVQREVREETQKAAEAWAPVPEWERDQVSAARNGASSRAGRTS
jgi:Putative peptidoglycan binding domain